MQEIKLRPELEIRTRTRILYDVIDELARAFLVQSPEATSAVLRRGILERQYLSAVHIYLIDDQNKRVAEITMEIDWSLHRLRIKGGQKEFSIDPTRSISQQLSEIFPVITRHIVRLKSAFTVTRSEVWYTYRRSVNLEEARKYVGTGKGTPPDWSNDSINDGIFLEFVSETLDELKITIRHKRNL